jgi:hypothetical protein
MEIFTVHEGQLLINPSQIIVSYAIISQFLDKNGDVNEVAADPAMPGFF